MTATGGPGGPTGSGHTGTTGPASDSGWFGSPGEGRPRHGSSAGDRTEIPGSRIADRTGRRPRDGAPAGGARGSRGLGPDPLAQGRITWGTTDPAGANRGEATPNGNAPYGSTPSADASSADASYGDASSADAPYGNAPYGNAPYGNAPYGNAPYGGTAYGNVPNDAAPSGARPTGTDPARADPARADSTRTDPFGTAAPGAAPPPGPGHAHRGTGTDADRTDVLPSAGPAAPAVPTRALPATAALRDPWQETPGTDGDAGADAGGHTHDPHEVTVQLDAVQLGDGVLLRADGGHRKSGPEASEGPVFVDASGRRSRLYRRLGILVGIACAVYAVVIVSTLLSGNSDAPWMPVPAQEEGAPAGQVDTTPLPSQSAQPSGTGTADPRATPSTGTGATTAPGVEAPASGTSGASGTTGRPGTSAVPESSAPGTGRNPGGTGATGPDPTQSTQAPPPATTDPSATTGGGTTADPATPTGGSTTGTDPGTGGTNANGASDPGPVAGPAGEPVVVAEPGDISTSPSLSPENTL
ncbi:hypothetical protein [Streptomyces sp. NPDC048392]|uniref:hypothetical protein n=1 Tax=Streptomyces sp. NPDC048392 TaxID=3365543 RepID=UPI0037182AEE